MVSEIDIRTAAQALNLSGRPVCVHSSFRSFGGVEGGPLTVINGLLAEGCTVMVPAFASYIVYPPDDPRLRPARNGWRYDAPPSLDRVVEAPYRPDTTEIDFDEMGAVPTAIVNYPERRRSVHPFCSFAAVGPLAERLLDTQTLSNAMAPLQALADEDGVVVLMGVGLTKLTLLHLAERRAGRIPFRRWTKGPDGRIVMGETGGCSDGFDQFAPALNDLLCETWAGPSRWWKFPARETLVRAEEAIRANPRITHCGDSACDRCNDAMLGGPLLTG